MGLGNMLIICLFTLLILFFIFFPEKIFCRHYLINLIFSYPEPTPLIFHGGKSYLLNSDEVGKSK